MAKIMLSGEDMASIDDKKAEEYKKQGEELSKIDTIINNSLVTSESQTTNDVVTQTDQQIEQQIAEAESITAGDEPPSKRKRPQKTNRRTHS